MSSRFSRGRTIAICFGTRPKLNKFAHVIRAFRQRGVKRLVINSGHHTDLLGAPLKQFGIRPDFKLDTMSAGQIYLQT